MSPRLLGNMNPCLVPRHEPVLKPINKNMNNNDIHYSFLKGSLATFGWRSEPTLIFRIPNIFRFFCLRRDAYDWFQSGPCDSGFPDQFDTTNIPLTSLRVCKQEKPKDAELSTFDYQINCMAEGSPKTLPTPLSVLPPTHTPYPFFKRRNRNRKQENPALGRANQW